MRGRRERADGSGRISGTAGGRWWRAATSPAFSWSRRSYSRHHAARKRAQGQRPNRRLQPNWPNAAAGRQQHRRPGPGGSAQARCTSRQPCRPRRRRRRQFGACLPSQNRGTAGPGGGRPAAGALLPPAGGRGDLCGLWRRAGLPAVRSRPAAVHCQPPPAAAHHHLCAWGCPAMQGQLTHSSHLWPCLCSLPCTAGSAR